MGNVKIEPPKLSISKKKSCLNLAVGLVTDQLYRDHIHGPNIDTSTDEFHGQKVVPRTLVWLVHQGDVILPDAPIDVSFSLRYKFSSDKFKKGQAQVTFVATPMLIPPSTKSKFTEGRFSLPLKLYPRLCLILE